MNIKKKIISGILGVIMLSATSCSNEPATKNMKLSTALATIITACSTIVYGGNQLDNNNHLSEVSGMSNSNNIDFNHINLQCPNLFSNSEDHIYNAAAFNGSHWFMSGQESHKYANLQAINSFTCDVDYSKTISIKGTTESQGREVHIAGENVVFEISDKSGLKKHSVTIDPNGNILNKDRWIYEPLKPQIADLYSFESEILDLGFIIETYCSINNCHPDLQETIKIRPEDYTYSKFFND